MEQNFMKGSIWGISRLPKMTIIVSEHFDGILNEISDKDDFKKLKNSGISKK